MKQGWCQMHFMSFFERNIMELSEGSAEIKGHSSVSNMDSVWCHIFRLTVVKGFVTFPGVIAWGNLSKCLYQSLSTSYLKNKNWVLRSDWFIYYHSILHAHIIYRAHTQTFLVQTRFSNNLYFIFHTPANVYQHAVLWLWERSESWIICWTLFQLFKCPYVLLPSRYHVCSND